MQDRYRMMRRYYAMLIERGEPDTVGKMKQFATYFTHGVRHGAQLRAAIYHAQRGRRQILDLVDEFFPAAAAGVAPMKKVQAHHRWRLPRQSRPRRLGLHPALQRAHEGTVGSEPHTTNNRMELTRRHRGAAAR